MTAINAVTDLSKDGDIAVITLNSPPVNALSANVRDGLYEGFKAAIADASVKGIVLICDGRTFIAGADISEFGGAMKGASLPDVQKMMEDSPKPVVAAIHGTALGGGLEVALCAHYRVAVPSARCGLPEVNLGLLPGAGGTQRLPRIAGVEKALEMMTSGQHVPAKECLAMGLVDELAEEGKLREAAIAFARKITAENRPLKKVRENDTKLEPAKGHPEIFAKFRKDNARKFRGFEAPEYNIQCIEAAVNQSFEDGMATERKLFMELMMGPQSAAQRYAFFAERTANKIPDVPDDTKIIPIKKVGIIGAGTMGGGIAMNFANAGIPVTLVEVKQDALDRGLGVVRKNYETSAKRGRFTMDEAEKRISLLKGSLAMEALADRDLVIEAVFERMDIKKDIFTKLDAIVKQGAILATNTSGLNIDEIASVTKRPEYVIGLHFFSPANVMKLLEIVRAEKTSKEVIATCDEARQDHRQNRRPGRGLPGLRRQPHARAARPRGAEDGARRRDAVGRRSRALRFRLPDGTVRDERSRRPRHRLGEGEVAWRDHPRRALRDGPPRPEDRRGLLRLRREPQRQALARHRKDHQGLRGQERAQPAHDLRRGDPRALDLSDDQRGREDPRGEEGDPRQATSMWCG